MVERTCLAIVLAACACSDDPSPSGDAATTPDALAYVQQKLRRMGVERALARAGAREALKTCRTRLEREQKGLKGLMPQLTGKYAKAVSRIAPAALEALLAHAWPGNVRELENVIQRAVVLASGEEITVDGLPAALRVAAKEAPRTFDIPFARAKQEAVDAFERGYVSDALTKTRGSVAEAAGLCGLDKSNFRRLVRRHKLDAISFRKT